MFGFEDFFAISRIRELIPGPFSRELHSLMEEPYALTFKPCTADICYWTTSRRSTPSAPCTSTTAGMKRPWGKTSRPCKQSKTRGAKRQTRRRHSKSCRSERAHFRGCRSKRAHFTAAPKSKGRNLSSVCCQSEGAHSRTQTLNVRTRILRHMHDSGT